MAVAEEAAATETAETSNEGVQPTQAAESQDATLLTEQTAPDKTAKGEAAEGKPDAKTGAPDSYEFKDADGSPLTGDHYAAFSEHAKSLGLSQEAAQKALETAGAAWQSRQQEHIQSVRDEWAKSARADKEIGGEKFDANLAVAKSALDRFASKELRNLLHETGLGNNPEVIRLLHAVGKAIGEDSTFVSGRGPAPREKTLAERLYPSLS